MGGGGGMHMGGGGVRMGGGGFQMGRAGFGGPAGIRTGGFGVMRAGYGGYPIRAAGLGGGVARYAMYNPGRTWNRGQWNGNRVWHGRRFARFGFGIPWVYGAAYGAGYYASDYYGYGDDDCYQTIRVVTPYGPQWQSVNVCY